MDTYVSISIDNKTKIKTSMDGYVEINPEYLGFFYGCWVNCIDKRTNEKISGGFLAMIRGDSVRLRNIKCGSELLDFDISTYIFCIKNNTEQYFFMQKITRELECLRKLNSSRSRKNR